MKKDLYKNQVYFEKPNDQEDHLSGLKRDIELLKDGEYTIVMVTYPPTQKIGGKKFNTKINGYTHCSINNRIKSVRALRRWAEIEEDNIKTQALKVFEENLEKLKNEGKL